MKLIKKLLLAIITTLAVLMVMSKIVPQMQNVGAVQAASVKISSTKKTMYKGYTYKLKVTGTNKIVKWSTSDKSKATVNSNGKVYAKKNGKVTITAKVGSKKYNCKVTIKNKPYNLTQFSTTFYDLKDVAKEYRDVNNIKNYKDFVFDFDGDGKKDTIRLKNIGKDENGDRTYELQYNGKNFFKNAITYTEKVYIADLNKNDNNLEVIVETTELGDGVRYIIFSKNNSKMKQIDEISSMYISNYELKIDQKGKILLQDKITENISPKIYKEYYELRNNKITIKKLNLSRLNNIKFKTTNEMIFTTSMKNIQKHIEGNFKAFSIIGEDETGAIKVKLKNGTKGYLFTVAGFLAG